MGIMSPSPEDDLYRSFNPLRIPLSDQSNLLSQERNRTGVVLDSMEADLLTACGSFRTLQEHAGEICRAGNLEASLFAPILYQLAQLARSGLLVSRSSLVERIRSAASKAEPTPPLTTLGIVTRNRPEALARCLESYLLNARQYSRKLRCVVVDDSDPGSAQANRARLVELKKRYGAEIFYAGSEEKDRFIRDLVSEGTREDDARFALSDPERCGFTPGANRNALLLETVGELLVSVDDDTVCKTAPSPVAGGGLSLSSENDPTEFWFYSDRDALLAAVRFEDRDFMGAHEALLGKSLGAWTGSPEDVDFESLDPLFLRHLEAGEGRVCVTMNGLLGDSGMGGTGGYLTLEGPSRERLIASESAYRSARAGREVLRCATRPTIVNRPFLMTPGVGLDNRELLPPFMPVMRNEDGLFGLVLRQGWERSVIAHLPWMLLHSPMEARKASMGGVLGVDSYDLVFAALASIDLGRLKADGAPRLRALGRHLTELASLGAGGFENAVRRLLYSRAEGTAGKMNRMLERHDRSPGYWAEDVRQSLEGLRRTLESGDFPTPRDLQAGRTPEEARELGRRGVQRYGRLLEAWPELVQATRSLRNRGRTLAPSI